MTDRSVIVLGFAHDHTVDIHRDGRVRLSRQRPPEHDLRGQAGKITAPAVLIWGRHDPVLPLRAAETARDLIHGSRLVVIESGHLPHTTSPAAVAAELTSLAKPAFGVGSRTSGAQDNSPAMKEQE
jgi:pimeloyl-ACP methyl ester carboxylesterase